MAVPRHASGRVGVFVLLIVATGAPVVAAEVLFPAPLHLTRQITDPISGVTTTVEEYCHGNRIVSMAGHRTAIADHSAQTLTVIDFGNGTYSVSSFAELAAPRGSGSGPVRVAGQWRVVRDGHRLAGSRNGDALLIERVAEGGSERIRLTADREVTLSDPAFEALHGVAYPGSHGDELEAIRDALRVRSGGNARPRLQLPLEWTVSLGAGDDALELRNLVTRVGTELPPAHAMTIPPSARRVDPPAIAAERLLRELDRPPAAQR